MLTKEQIAEYSSGAKTEIFHKVKGKGTVESVRTDRLAENRLKAKINFVIPDLLEDVVKPEFIYLDDENLSAE